MLNYFTLVHSDEEEAEEASEDKDKDSLESADSSRNATPKLSKPRKAIDLGAAANYGKSEIVNSSAQSSNVSTSVISAAQVRKPDLVDLLLDTSPAVSQPFQSSATVSGAPVQNDGFFADFASAPPGGGSVTGTESSNGKKVIYQDKNNISNID